MSDFFRTQGRSLLANGYLVLPIKPGEKRPAIASWQTARLTAADLPNYPSHGVGIVCGQGASPVVGVDIDISHPTINASLLEWCRKWLPGAPERIGAAPRTLLLYRAPEAGWTKGVSTTFFDPTDPKKPNGKPNDQRIEMLGFGQQFVAYHVHPDTGRPYEWDWTGGPEFVKASELPLLTETNVAELMAELDRLVRGTSGLTIKSIGEVSHLTGSAGNALGADDWLAGYVPPVGMPIEDVRALLAFMPGSDQYDLWVRVGMALWHETEGSEQGFQLWNEWSAQAKNYDAAALRHKWPSFAPTPGRSATTLRWIMKVAGEAKRDAELSMARDQVDAIKLKIATATDSIQMTGVMAKQIKALLPDDPAARAEVFKAFQDKFKALSGTVLPIAQVRQVLLPAPEKQHTVRSARPLTEFGNAERMLDRYAAGLMYVPELDQWYRWTGIYWHRCGEVEIQHYAKETIRALINEAGEHEGDSKFFEFCAISQKDHMVKSMVNLAKSDPRVMVPVGELDKMSHLLGVKNGVVDLRTGQLLPSDPEYRITMLAGCEYDRGARAPIFVQTVSDVFFGDLELMRFFHRLVGYSLLGKPDEDLLVIPWGNGSNGKSTVLNPIRAAFGSYGKSSAAETFVSNGQAGGGGGGPREDIVRLKGARFVYVNEPDENSELRESMVKSMSGGDAITARGLFAKASIEIEPTWVSWMPTNHKPIIKGNDNGIWRRIVLLPFLRNFEDDATIAKDEDRQAKLLQEMPGILAWAVQGAIKYAELGLAMPQGIRAARDEYRSQMDVLADWLAECCDIEPEAVESSSKLWSSWEQWAKRNGALRHVQSSISLGKRLENRFPSEKGAGGSRLRRGLRLKMDLDPFKEVP